MNLIRIIPLLFFWGAVPVSGFADDANEPLPPTKTDAVSESLEEFIDQAVGAGLLDVPGQSGVENNLQLRAPLREVTACGSEGLLDFSNFLDVRRYDDIAPYRKALVASDEAVEVDELIKAYLSLGLYAEAIATQDSSDQASFRVYTEIAKLLDGYQQADESFFHTLPECHSGGKLWLGISALMAKDVSGAPLLERHIEDFRDLPLQLRSDVAVLVLPTLRRNGLVLLGEKLLATFDKADVEQSSKLSIQVGFLEVQDAPSQEGYDFLARIAPGADELLPHLDGETPLGDAQRAIILEEAYKLIARPANNAESATALKFVLEDLSRQSDYNGFVKVLNMPSLLVPDFQSEIKAYLGAQLMADLGSEDKLAKLAAIDMLANNPDAISGHSAGHEIVTQAANFLQSQGQINLAIKLLNAQAESPTEAILSARIAHRQGNIEALYAIAQTNLDQPDIIYLAALSAVQNRDGDMFKRLEGHLPQQAERLVTLSEEDAIAGGWILSEQTYEAARSLGDPDQQARIQKVLSMKELAEERVTGLASRSIASRLIKVGSTLDQFEGGAR